MSERERIAELRRNLEVRRPFPVNEWQAVLREALDGWSRSLDERDGLAREVRAWRKGQDELDWGDAFDIRAANEAQGWPSGGAS